MVGKPRQRACDERGDRRSALVIEQLAVGQAAVVIDDGVKVVVTKRPRLVFVGLGAIAGDRVTGPGEPRIALDVHVQQIARARPLVATDRARRGPRPPRTAVADQDRVDGRVRDPGLAGDQPRSPAGALARLADPPLGLGIGAPRRAARTTRAIQRPSSRRPLLGRRLALAHRPPVSGGRRDREAGGRLPLGRSFTDQPDPLAAPSRSELGVS
jgi:hypothetical protein